MNKYRIALCWILICISLPSLSKAQNTIQAAIQQLMKDPSLKNASVGICVIDVKSGKILAKHDADRSLIPASSLKVVTTATALAILGPDYTFKTDLEYNGLLDKQGVLKGNLFLKGYGDPTFGSNQLEEAADLQSVMKSIRQAIQQKGIQTISGFVVGDASYFSTTVKVPSWQWNDLGNYYAAGAWGLNIHENLYYLRFRQASKIGTTPRISIIEPEIPDLNFQNEVRSASRGSGDNAYIYGGPYTFERYVRGTIPVGNKLFSIKGSIPNPPLFAAQYLQQQLKEIGIETQQGSVTQLDLVRRGITKGERRKIFTYYSPPLKVIVKRANWQSVNLYCESLLKTIGRARMNKGTTKAGVKSIREFWESKGLSFSGCYLEDGSGLSPRNNVTSLFMAQFMRKIATEKKVFQSFYESLPEAGRTGSLRNRFKGTIAVGKIRAKSGTLKRVRTFTGYAKDKSGNLRAFSILINNFSGSGNLMRRKMEKFVLTLCQ